MQGHGPATHGLDLGDRGRRALGIPAVVDADVVAGGGEREGDRTAEATAGAGDERGHRIRPTGSSRVSAAISDA